jgi:hypothetical protein
MSITNRLDVFSRSWLAGACGAEDVVVKELIWNRHLIRKAGLRDRSAFFFLQIRL